mgnify:CR=1 FL=1
MHVYAFGTAIIRYNCLITPLFYQSNMLNTMLCVHTVPLKFFKATKGPEFHFPVHIPFKRWCLATSLQWASSCNCYLSQPHSTSKIWHASHQILCWNQFKQIVGKLIKRWTSLQVSRGNIIKCFQVIWQTKLLPLESFDVINVSHRAMLSQPNT